MPADPGEERGELEVQLLRASKLAAKDSTGSSDPYCRISCIELTRSRKKKSSVKPQNLDPEWNERFFFPDTAGDARLVVDVYDEDQGKDDLIGKVTVLVQNLPRGKLEEKTYELIDGDVVLAIAFRPGKGGRAAAADYDEDPELAVLLPGGPDGRLQQGRKYRDTLKDLPHLVSELEETAERLRQSHGRLFEDEDFAGPRALFLDPKRVPADFLDGGKTEVVWRRPSELGKGKGMKLFFAEEGDLTDIEPDDIDQGQIGDCYFLAALATLASHPRLIKALLVEDFGELGMYGVKLFDWTGWTTVAVDDRFPSSKRHGTQLFCRSDSGSEFWAALFEKAWAKYHGCFEAIEGGDTADTLAYLTGGRVNQIQFSDRPDPDAFWEEMLQAFMINAGDEGDACFLCASGARGTRGGKEDPESVPKEDPGGLVSGHAYSVLELREALGQRLIKLRNPWGSFEWNGDWGDSSPLWTSEMKRAFQFESGDDGEFWMSWKDFLANFTRMGCVTTIPQNSPIIHLTGSWRSGITAGGEDTFITYNPRYLLQASGVSKVYITLSQPDTRAHGGGGFMEMHLRVFVMGKAADPHSPVEAEQVLEGAHKVVWFRSGTLEVEVDPAKGHFIVVPSLWAPGWEGDFGLTVACERSNVRITVQELAPLKPDPAAAAAMRAKPVSNKCATCGSSCPLGKGCKYFKKVRWHEGDHYHCYSCKTPFETERSTESYGAPGTQQRGPRSLPVPIHDVHEMDGRMQGFCKDCFRANFAPKCLFCAKPVDEGAYYTVSDPEQGRVHEHCYAGFQEKHADRCPVCALAVTGTFYRTDNGKVHADCYDQFQEMNADRCLVCGKAIVSAFYDLPEGKVHAEGDCYDKHQESKAPKCLTCGKPVTGQYYEVSEGAIHAEGDCFEKWQTRRR